MQQHLRQLPEYEGLREAYESALYAHLEHAHTPASGNLAAKHLLVEIAEGKSPAPLEAAIGFDDSLRSAVLQLVPIDSVGLGKEAKALALVSKVMVGTLQSVRHDASLFMPPHDAMAEKLPAREAGVPGSSRRASKLLKQEINKLEARHDLTPGHNTGYFLTLTASVLAKIPLALRRKQIRAEMNSFHLAAMVKSYMPRDRQFT